MIRKPIIVVLGHVDHGKCLAKGERVITKQGLVKIEDIFEKGGKIYNDGCMEIKKVDENVFSIDLDGKLKETKAIYACRIRYKGEMIKVKLKNWHEITVTPEHPFLTNNGWKRADEIREGDYVAVPRVIDYDVDFEEFIKYIFEKIADDEFICELNNKGLEKVKVCKEKLYKLYENVFRREDIENIDLECIEGFSYSKRIRKCGKSEYYIKFPKTIDDWKIIFYFAGVAFGDGSQNIIFNSSDDVFRELKKLERFGVKVCRVWDRTCYRIRIKKGGRILFKLLEKLFEYPRKEKSRNIRMPEILFRAPKILVSEFLRGYFDSDGFVEERQCRIGISSVSKDFLKDLSLLLLRFGIFSKIYEDEKVTTLYISGKRNLINFKNFIGFTIREKMKKLEKIIKRSKKSETYPLQDELRRLRIMFGFTRSEINKHIPFYSKIEKESKPSYEKIKKFIYLLRNIKTDLMKKIAVLEGKIKDKNLITAFEKDGLIKNGKLTEIGKEALDIWKKQDFDYDALRFLENLIENVVFLKVERVEKIKYDGYIYDLTTSTKNFIANGIIVHNTALLDKIRGTTVQLKEAGGITQHIGATEVPIDVIKKISGKLLEIFKVEFKIPGLLFIDTPGHAAFTSLRERGSSIADLAVLVVDVTAGFQPQTYESLEFLKLFKVPFVVAANKIDLIPGWKDQKTFSFLESIKKQREDVVNRLEEKIYEIIEKLNEQGFLADRFDRVTDFTREVAIVPTSAITGEGIAELLLLLAGLSQKYLEKNLKINVSGPARGTVIEKKEIKGLGTVIDVIIYDGKLNEKDFIVIGGVEKPVVTRIRAILKPKPLKEIRMSKPKEFERVKEVSAAAGVRIVAPNLEEVVPGMPFIACRDEKDIEKAKEEIQRHIKEVRFEVGTEGVVLRADSIGSLEAAIKMLKEEGIPIKKADIGEPTKYDISLLESFKEKRPELAVILCFNVEPSKEIVEICEQKGIKIVCEKIIYRLVEKYKEVRDEIIREKVRKELENLPFPAVFRILPGYVFRKSKPAIVGVEILEGTLKPNCYVMREDGKEIGFLKSIQSEGRPLKEATKGMAVAVSIEGPTVGRQIDEGDILYVSIPERVFLILKKYKDYLRPDEKEALKKIVRIKRSIDPLWGMK